jgi:ketosteroid isomerase-like protein
MLVLRITCREPVAPGGAQQGNSKIFAVSATDRQSVIRGRSMNASEISRSVASLDSGKILPRRSFLQFGVGGLALGTVLPGKGNRDDSHESEGRRTEKIARRVIHAFESRDTAEIWSFFAADGVFEFPFIGLHVQGFAEFDAALGPALSQLDGLRNTDLVVDPLADPEACIVRHNATATVLFTGKPLNLMYIDVVRLRHGKVTSLAIYYDTAVFNEATTP